MSPERITIHARCPLALYSSCHHRLYVHSPELLIEAYMVSRTGGASSEGARWRTSIPSIRNSPSRVQILSPTTCLSPSRGQHHEVRGSPYESIVEPTAIDGNDDNIIVVNDNEEEDDDDGLHQIEYDVHSVIDEGGFGNDEKVEIGADAYTWKIDHNKSHHRLRGRLRCSDLVLRTEC